MVNYSLHGDTICPKCNMAFAGDGYDHSMRTHPHSIPEAFSNKTGKNQYSKGGRTSTSGSTRGVSGISAMQGMKVEAKLTKSGYGGIAYGTPQGSSALYSRGGRSIVVEGRGTNNVTVRRSGASR